MANKSLRLSGVRASCATTVQKRPLYEQLDIRRHVVILFLFLVGLGFHQAALDNQAEARLKSENMLLKQQVWEQHLPADVLLSSKNETSEI